MPHSHIAADTPLGLAANLHLVAATSSQGAMVRCGSVTLALSAQDLSVITLLDGKRTLTEVLAAAPRPLLALDLVRRLRDQALLGTAPLPQAQAATATLPPVVRDALVPTLAFAAAALCAHLASALTVNAASSIALWTIAAALSWHTAPFLPGWGRRRANAMLGVPDSGKRLRSWLTRRVVRNTLRQGDIERVEQRYLVLAAWSFCHGFAIVVLSLGFALPVAAQFALHGLPGNHSGWATVWRAIPLLATVGVAAPPLAVLLLVLFWLIPQLMPKMSARPSSADALSQETLGRFAEALGALPAFAPLGPEKLAELAGVARMETHGDRAIVLQQGEKGDRLCWLAQGRVRIRVEDESGMEHEVAELQPGAFFGETALLEPVARTATVIASGPVHVAALGRQPFLAALAQLGAQAEEVKDQLRTAAVLRNHPLFCALDAEGLRSLLQSAQVLRFGAGQAAVRQGDAGDVLFVVREGQFEVQRESKGKTKKLAKLRHGDWFGELALLADGKRTATVTAIANSIAVQVPLAAVESAVLRDAVAALHLLQAASERMALLRQEEGQ
ncbi:MAG: cyclic nucleotide-binding domain-containing protein [Myxococcales bacterium]|nr:cyclic nucleotide-binding domain-containing protein [Myxococcales bacterium]